MNEHQRFIKANWPAPDHVTALSTTRFEGASNTPFNQNNLAFHVGDAVADVVENRNALMQSLLLPKEPAWLEQTHTNRCVVIEQTSERHADAAVTRIAQNPLVIMTADCLPITLCDQKGVEVAAIHAGWKGLADGIIENTLNTMHTPPDKLLAWIGPAICGQCYEVGVDFKDAFPAHYKNIAAAFTTKDAKHFANLPLLAELVLKSCGLQRVYQSNLCTFELKDEFFSYRRAAKTGRIGTLIWFHEPNLD